MLNTNLFHQNLSAFTNLYDVPFAVLVSCEGHYTVLLVMLMFAELFLTRLLPKSFQKQDLLCI